MSDEFSDEIDGILSDVLEDVSPEGSESIEQEVTTAQAVSPEQQTDIISDHINWLCGELDVPDATADLAESLADQYRDQRGGLHGTALELVAASCLYCAVKVTEVPLDPTDFVDAGRSIVTRKSLLRRSKDIATTVGLDPSAFFETDQYVDRYCDALGVSSAVNDRAHEIIDITEKEGLSSGKSPSGWAAAAVYNACLDTGNPQTQTDLCEVANTTEVTIRNRYQEQRALLRQIESLPSDPADVANHIADVSDVQSMTRELAVLLIHNTRSAGQPVDKESTLWGLAALRRASQLTEGDVSLKTLSQYTDEDSIEISKRTKELRSVIDQASLIRFRNEWAGRSTE